MYFETINFLSALSFSWTISILLAGLSCDHAGIVAAPSTPTKSTAAHFVRRYFCISTSSPFRWNLFRFGLTGERLTSRRRKQVGDHDQRDDRPDKRSHRRFSLDHDAHDKQQRHTSHHNAEPFCPTPADKGSVGEHNVQDRDGSHEAAAEKRDDTHQREKQ